MRVIDRIRAVAEQRPRAIACCGERNPLTYRQLMERVDGLAHDLRRLGILPNSRVAICLDRSPELIVAILATLAAGAAYVPLDPDFPAARLRQIIEDSEPALILGSADAAALSADGRVPILDPRQWSRARRAVDVPSRGPAYLIYTSGSTGRPKGVVVGRASLNNYLAWAVAALPFAGDGVPLVASVSFDHAVTCYFPPLLMGDCLVLLPPLQGGRNLAAGLLTGRRYSYVKITPSHFRLLDPDARAELGRCAGLVMFGGEQVSASLIADVRRDRPSLPVMNHYGPTEATVGCCVYRVPPGAVVDPVPIGRPLPGVDAVIRREDGAPAQDKDFGELLIGGKALARGYWRSPEHTAAKFISLPNGRGKARRWYCTGDMAQRTASGDLICLGRRDDQVKILGHRIELAEVEAGLRAYPGVRQAAVITAETAGLPGLVAAVATSVPKPSESDLRAHLYACLPSVMVPRRIAILDQLPIGAGGKLDRAALLKALAPDDTPLPPSTVEEIVARKFVEALDQPSIRFEDDFFELGGDSIATIEIVISLREHFGISLEPTALFEYPTVRALAGYIRSCKRNGPPD